MCAHLGAINKNFSVAQQFGHAQRSVRQLEIMSRDDSPEDGTSDPIIEKNGFISLRSETKHNAAIFMAI